MGAADNRPIAEQTLPAKLVDLACDPPEEGGDVVTTFVINGNPPNGPLGEAYRQEIDDYREPNRPLITRVLAESPNPPLRVSPRPPRCNNQP
jgi:hypothetical protein